MLTPAGFEEFAALAREYDIVPVVHTVSADLHTPLAAYLKTCDDEHSFLFESIEGGEHLARYSFMGAVPERILRLKAAPGPAPDLLGTLRKELGGNTVAPVSDAPFLGGMVGFLGYAMARCFEPSATVLASGGDDAALMLYRSVIIHDRLRQTLQFCESVNVADARGEPAELQRRHRNAVERNRRSAARLERPLSYRRSGGAGAVSFTANQTRARFEERVRRVQELIAAGEVYQTVISQRFSAETAADAVSIYRALRRSNPSPYMFLLRMGRDALIGASPEMLVRCRSRHLEYRPIAGTRARGMDEGQDARLAEELPADEKERAEHIMLVDLGRNDLGRVAKTGSVRVKGLMRVEKFSHVQHLVTDLTAELRDDMDCFDALASCFPAGTVTGAPKIRAMQAIAEIEPGPRGVYSGAVFYADHAGNLDSCIAIRTIELSHGTATVQAGAGIVADSRPGCEYEETLHKARALQQAVIAAEAGA